MSTKAQRVKRRNGDLLREVAAVIRSFPDSYEQTAFGIGDKPKKETIEFADHTVKEISCGTSHCIGGWAAALSGYNPTFVTEKNWDGSEEETLISWNTVEKDGADPVDVEDIAAQLLGLRQYNHDIALYDEREDVLFGVSWKPKGYHRNLSKKAKAGFVADALEALADGATLDEVTYNGH